MNLEEFTRELSEGKVDYDSLNWKILGEMAPDDITVLHSEVELPDKKLLTGSIEMGGVKLTFLKYVPKEPSKTLVEQLRDAVENEDYETAAKLKKEIDNHL